LPVKMFGRFRTDQSATACDQNFHVLRCAPPPVTRNPGKTR
jgi:hypothetical protein